MPFKTFLLLVLLAHLECIQDYYSYVQHKLLTVSELWSFTCHMGSDSVTCFPKHMNASTLFSTRLIGWYFIYQPQKDRKLSWPCMVIVCTWSCISGPLIRHFQRYRPNFIPWAAMQPTINAATEYLG